MREFREDHENKSVERIERADPHREDGWGDMDHEPVDTDHLDQGELWAERDALHDAGDRDEGWGSQRQDDQASAHQQKEKAENNEDRLELPISAEIFQDRTSISRINLADDVTNTDYQYEYDGYLDVVMHGNKDATWAHIDGQRVDFSFEQTAQLIEQCPTWEDRPIRLMSCRTGEADYAQNLADRLQVPVYAPDGYLHVRSDGTKYVKHEDGTAGSWRRFEPGR
jgi:hypothetical protein